MSTVSDLVSNLPAGPTAQNAAAGGRWDAPIGAVLGQASGETLGARIAEVIETLIQNLGSDGYQTGVGLVAATTAIIAMINAGVNRLVVVPITVGAFWGGWLLWNTLASQNNPLFPGDVEVSKIWDVAIGSDRGFLLAAILGCVVAFFLTRRGATLLTKFWLIVGSVLGASFILNLVDAVRTV